MQKSNLVIFIIPENDVDDETMNKVGELMANHIVPLVSERTGVGLLTDCVGDMGLHSLLKQNSCDHIFTIDDSGDSVRCIVGKCDAEFPLEDM